MSEDVSTIVLAGGKGLRLGQEKASLKINGTFLIEQVIERLAPLGTDIIVVVSQDQTQLTITHPVRIVKDIYADKRALGGVYSGLMASSSLYNMVVACDMPFLNIELIRYLISLSGGSDVVIPKIGNNVEPLHAVYSRNCLSYIEEMFTHNNLQVSSLLKFLKVRYVDENDINKYDPEHLSVFNINNQDDLDKAKRLMEVLT